MKTNKPLIPFPLGEVKHTNGPKILYQISPALLCTQCEREVKTHEICFSHHFLQISLVILYLTLICGLRALDFPGGTSSKEPACQWRRHKRQGSIPESGRSSGGGHGNPLQYSCLENPMDRGAWWATIHGVAKTMYATEHARIHIFT